MNIFEKIVERLEEEKYQNSFFGSELLINKAIEIVNQVAEEYNNGWIACSERLPRIGEQVMVCNRYGSVFTSHITYLNPRVDIHGECHDFGSHYGVIAWQPLPEAYKEGEQP